MAHPGAQGADPLPRPRDEAAVRDHLANERTLLAWQRTALGVVAIGFLVDRFALDRADGSPLGSLLGLVLVLLGAGISVLGAYRFVHTERQIDTHTYQPALAAHLLVTGAVVAGSAALALYLLVDRG